MRFWLGAVVLMGCGLNEEEAEVAPLSLSEVLGPDEVRAGVVNAPDELFGGISAEGRVGDIKIYNDRVRFVIQAVREGDFYLAQGGAVVDADIVRPEGQLGRDAVDEWDPMAGLGRVVDPKSVEVVADGQDGQDAVVRVKGLESPVEYLTGAVESLGLVADLGLSFETEYRLAPGSRLLQVSTTLSSSEEDVAFSPGDVLLASDDAGASWLPGLGLGAAASTGLRWAGWLDDLDAVALGMFPETDIVGNDGNFGLFRDLLEASALFGDSVEMAPNSSYTWTRWYGVGPDLASLSSEWREQTGQASQEVTGQVNASDGPVAGARVIVSVDAMPDTVAVTDGTGQFRALVPPGEATTLVDARGSGWVFEHPTGAAPTSAYTTPQNWTAAMEAYAGGALGVPSARGRGVSDTLDVGTPAQLEVRVEDGLPFEVRVELLDPEPAADTAVVRSRPGGWASVGWSRDSDVTLPLEEGSYRVVAHRGLRFERATEEVVLRAGEQRTLTVSLDAAFDHAGWMLGDPHIHAAPSPDAYIPMADRLLTVAGTGVQLHFGTDHDTVVDYRPLLEPLGLSSVLASVVAVEVSPVVRGHSNVYPVEVKEGPNGGAYLWYRQLVADTETHYAQTRQSYGPDAFVQVNHPIGTGLADFAGWADGQIGRSDFWSDDFELVEVNNGGDWDRAYPFFADLVSRGYGTVPVGVSDAHGPLSGGMGLNTTWFGLGTDDVADYTDAALAESIRAGRTVVSRGVFITSSVTPGETVTGALTLDVEALSASWAPVDRMVLYVNGEPTQTVKGTQASFVVDVAEDAWVAVMAEGDTSMGPIYNTTPWAMTAPIYVDVEGDGWEAPMPPLTLLGG